MSLSGPSNGESKMTDLVEYMARVERLRDAIDTLGIGARTEASFDCRIALSRVSAVVGGREVNPEILSVLEAWAAARAVGKSEG